MTTSQKFSADRVRYAVANRYNPIRGLTPQTLLSKVEGWRRGDLRLLALLWEEMEERDWVMKNVVAKRKRDAARCEWEIMVEDDSPEAEAQKEFLEEFYSKIQVSHAIERDLRGGISLLLRQMMDSVGKRYAVHEVIWKPSPGSLTADFIFVPLWFFEARAGKLAFLETDTAIDGTPLAPYEWMVTVGDGLMLASSFAYVAKDLGFKDWLNVSEKFGVPGLDAETDAAPGSAEWNQLRDALEAFGRDWAMVRNRSAKINLIEMKNAGSLPQPPLVEYIDRALASLWRGADLSTISANAGQGQGASIQGNESDLLREDDCGILSETLNEFIDKPALQWRFGPDVEQLAYFRVRPPIQTDKQKDLWVDRFLLEAGAPLGVADTLERYSRPMPSDGEDLLVYQPKNPGAGFGDAGGPGPSPAPGQSEPANDAPGSGDGSDQSADMANAATAQMQALRTAFAQDLQPVRDRIKAILTIEDPEIMAQKLRAFRGELPGLLRSINADPAAAREFEGVFAARLLDGITQSVPRARADKSGA